MNQLDVRQQDRIGKEVNVKTEIQMQDVEVGLIFVRKSEVPIEPLQCYKYQQLKTHNYRNLKRLWIALPVQELKSNFNLELINQNLTCPKE